MGEQAHLLTFLAAALAACNQPGEVSAPAPPAPPRRSPPRPTPRRRRPRTRLRLRRRRPRPGSGSPRPISPLPDLDGKPVKLAVSTRARRSSSVVQPGCPFVQLAHRQGGLKDVPAQHTQKGVVWLAINSGAPGQAGHHQEEREGKGEFGMSYPVLIDEKGDVRARVRRPAHTAHGRHRSAGPRSSTPAPSTARRAVSPSRASRSRITSMPHWPSSPPARRSRRRDRGVRLHRQVLSSPPAGARAAEQLNPPTSASCRAPHK